MENCKPLIDTFKGKVSHYVFVSSAGAYKADAIEPMHVEGEQQMGARLGYHLVQCKERG